MNLSAPWVSWMQDAAFPSWWPWARPRTGRRASGCQLIPFALVLGIFYFVILLPMKRKQQKVQTVPRRR